MTVQLVFDDNKLLQEAQNIGQHQTESEAVMAALREYVQRRKQLQIVELFGEIEYEPGYAPKAQRKVG